MKAESEAETGARPTGTETRYETGFYQIISCHTDDDAAAELTPGLAFPVNAAANQTRPQSPPFSSFRPATLTRATVSLCSFPRAPSSSAAYPSVSVSIPLCFAEPRTHRYNSTFRPFSSSLVLSFGTAPARPSRRHGVFPLLERSHGRKQKLLVGAPRSQLADSAHLHARNL